MPPHPEHARWFSDEVHPHDAQRGADLRGSFPAVRDVDDVVQESYLRAWRGRAEGPIHSARAFLFTVARRLAIDGTNHAARELANEKIFKDWSRRIHDELRRRARAAAGIASDRAATSPKKKL